MHTGLTTAGDWSRPTVRLDPDGVGLTLLEGEFTISRALNVSAEHDPDEPVTCTLRYEVCDERMCLPPTSETLEVSSGAGATVLR